MKIKIKALIILVMLIFQIVFITGCWSSREVEDLAITTLIGFDLVKENGIDKWQISARILNPGGQQQEGKTDQKSGQQEILWKGTGINIQAAMLDFIKRSPKTIFFGHVNAFILGERVAKEEMSKDIAAHMQFWEISPRVFVLATKGEAYKILQAGPELGPSISKQVQQLSEKTSKKFGTSIGVTLSEISAMILGPDRDGVLTQIKVVYPEEKKVAEVTEPDKSAFLEGLGVFRGDKLVGWLNREETWGYLFIAQKLTNVNVLLTVYQNGKSFSYMVGTSKSKIEPQLTGGDKLQVRITIQTLGAALGVVGDEGRLDLSPEVLEAMETAAAETIRKIALIAIDKAKEYNADYLGIMQKLHRTDLAAWQKVQPHWRETFQDAEIEVNVQSKIVSTGQLTQFEPQK